MNNPVRLLSQLSTRVCIAITVAFITWTLASRGAPLHAIATILDVPVALTTRFIPLRAFKGIDLLFGGGVGEFMPTDEVLLWHVRASILTYVPLLYVLDVGRKKLAQRGGRAVTSE